MKRTKRNPNNHKSGNKWHNTCYRCNLVLDTYVDWQYHIIDKVCTDKPTTQKDEHETQDRH